MHTVQLIDTTNQNKKLIRRLTYVVPLHPVMLLIVKHHLEFLYTEFNTNHELLFIQAAAEFP